MSKRFRPLKATVVIFNLKEAGEALPQFFDTIRPVETPKESTAEFIERLIRQYGDKPSYNKPSQQDIDLLRTAFPSRVADRILTTDYDGSNLITDTRQDLLGEKYLESQIRKMNEENRQKSILDTYNYMLYEGDRSRPLEHRVYPIGPPQEMRRVKPIKTSYFKLSDLTF